MQNQIQVSELSEWLKFAVWFFGVLIGLIGVTTWLTYPPVIKNWCLSALLPIASFKCMIWMIYIYILYIYAWIESDFHVGVSYPSITSVANCTDVYRLPFIPNGTKWSTREIMENFFPQEIHMEKSLHGDFNVLGKTSPPDSESEALSPCSILEKIKWRSWANISRAGASSVGR